MNRINIKPLSVNEVWQGKRYRTKKYDVYISNVLMLLPSKMPFPSLVWLDIVVGYSNSSADIDNCLKPFIDCLQKKYDFNDRTIYKLSVEKQIVKKGFEFIEFDVREYKKEVCELERLTNLF